MFDAGVRRVTGRRPILPWIPYPAIRSIRKLAKPNWRVLEHGSGMSTIWWSYLVDHVDSVEADRHWHATICKFLEERGRTNVSLSLKSNSSSQMPLSISLLLTVTIEKKWQRSLVEF